MDELEVGGWVFGRVVGIADGSLVIALSDGVEGTVPPDELSPFPAKPEDIADVGDELWFKLVGREAGSPRVVLSVRRACEVQPREWPPWEEGEEGGAGVREPRRPSPGSGWTGSNLHE